MAGNSATLTVKVLTDASGAQKGIDQAQGAVGKFESGVSKLTPAALAVGAGLVVMGKQAVDAASELQQAQGSVESVYGSAAGAVERYASTSADRLGLAASEYMNYSSLVGSALQNAGFSAEKAAAMSDKAMTRGADMAATFGGTTAEAVDAINAAVARGEYDSLERYGVSLNKTAVDAELAKRGQDDLTGSALKNAQAQATLDLIYQQTGKSAGQFADESDTAAGQQQRATAAFQDASAELGGALLPAVTKVTAAFTQLINWVAQNKNVALALAGVIGGLAAAVLGLNVAFKTLRAAQGIMAGLRAAAIGTRIQLIALTAAQTAMKVATVAWNAVVKVATVVQRAFNAVMRANPIGIVITAIMLLVGAIVLLWNKNAAFRNFVKGVWAAIAGFAKAAWNAIKSAASAVLGWITARFRAVKAFISGVWRAIRSAATSAFNGIKSVIGSVVNWIRSRFNALKAFISGVWRAIRSAATSAMGAVRSVVTSVIGAIRSAFRALGSAVRSVFSGIRSAASAAFNGIRSVVSSVVGAIRSAFTSMGSAMRSVWSSLRSAASGALNAILAPVRALQAAFNAVVSAIRSVVSWIGRIRLPDLSGLNPFSAPNPTAAAASTYAAAAPPVAAYGHPSLVGALSGLGGSGGGLFGAGGGPVVVNINVTGGLSTAPDIAKAVRKVIRDDSRRRGGIVIDRPRERVS